MRVSYPRAPCLRSARWNVLQLEEQRLLENSLTELRFRYVEAVERFAKKK